MDSQFLQLFCRIPDLETWFDELTLQFKTDAQLPPTWLRRRKYLHTVLLIVDELGFKPMSRNGASLFLRPVTFRYGRDSMLIAPSKCIPDWTELLAVDESLADLAVARVRPAGAFRSLIG